jgi:hypothetical protein
VVYGIRDIKIPVAVDPDTKGIIYLGRTRSNGISVITCSAGAHHGPDQLSACRRGKDQRGERHYQESAAMPASSHVTLHKLTSPVIRVDGWIFGYTPPARLALQAIGYTSMTLLDRPQFRVEGNTTRWHGARIDAEVLPVNT